MTETRSQQQHGKKGERQAAPPADEPENKTNLPANASAGTDVMVYDFGDDAGAGMENVRKEERRIPFVVILDPKSPQCKPVSAGGVPNAKGGSFYNTATGEVYDGEKGFDFIPVYRDENFPEFIPREPDGSGGGFVGIRAKEDPLIDQLREKQGKFGKLKTADNTELVQTFYLYGLILSPDDGTPSPAMLGFKSTQIKKYQGLITRQDAIQYPGKEGKMTKPPLWSHVWHVSSRYETNKGANSWYGYVIRLREEPSVKSLLKMTDPLYKLGKALFASIASGEKRADYEGAAKTSQQSSQGDEEIPM